MLLRALAFIVIGFSSQLLASDQPTIVVFLSDDHGQLDSSPYGSPDARTPNLAKLAQAGMTFTHAFVASPSCAPSRSAMLTGLMPARNGAEANHTYKRDDVVSLPSVLGGLGYEIAAFGKVAHGKIDVKRHGFNHFDPSHDAKVVAKYLADRDPSKPLCLFVGTHAPHVPWPENNGYDSSRIDLPKTSVDTPETRIQRTRYLSAVTDADSDLGDIADLVSSRFPREKTLFVYTSDHGAQWPFGKWNLYDSGIRVPFIASWPGMIQPSSSSNAMIQWIDLWPTFIEIAGGTTSSEIDGRSFAGVLMGRTSTHRSEIFTTHSGDGDKNIYPIRSVRFQNLKYIRNLYPENAFTSHIDRGGGSGDGWRYFDEWVAAAKSDPAAALRVSAYHKRLAEELYDLEKDPSELNNLVLAPEYSEKLGAMRIQLDNWMLTQGDQKTLFNAPLGFDAPYPKRESKR